MLRRTPPRKPNGNAGLGRPNGHGPASVPAGDARPAPASLAPTPGREGGGVQVSACPGPAGSQLDHAASDDASRTSVARAEALPATASLPTQASTVCEAYAAVAPPLTQSLWAEAGGEEKPPTDGTHPAGDDPKTIPGGTVPLPPDAKDFVEEIHRRVDMFEVWVGLLRNKDDKIRQRAVEKLTDFNYKGLATSTEDSEQQVIIDIDSAVARRAAQGAKK